jgi:protein-tyrosine phosphatase
MFKIRQNLYLGNLRSALKLEDNSINAILNVSETSYRSKVPVYQVSMKDDVNSIILKEAEAINILQKLISENKTVLIHCKHGKSRSPHILAKFISIAENKPYDEIYNEIRSIKTDVLHYSVEQELIDKRMRK